jgi:hypothetical protein
LSCLDLIFISLMYFQWTGYMDGHIGSWRLFRSSSMSHLRHKYLFGIRSFSGVRFHDGDHGPRSHVASHLLPSSYPLSLRRHRRTHSFFDNLKKHSRNIYCLGVLNCWLNSPAWIDFLVTQKKGIKCCESWTNLPIDFYLFYIVPGFPFYLFRSNNKKWADPKSLAKF